MALFILSFIAGVLTVAAPCILPLLPVIVGGSLVEANKDKPDKQWVRPLVVAASLAISVIFFTLLIKATTAFLGVPQIIWQALSGGLVVFLGINFLWPHMWERFSTSSGLFTRSNTALGKATRHKGFAGAVLMGLALGPVFSSCSPTYALIVAAVLPVSFVRGFLYLTAYAVGMSATLLLISYVGQTFVSRLKWLSNPSGWSLKVVGVLFIVVGFSVLAGYDKKLQAYILERGWYDPIGNFETRLTE